MSRAWVVLGLCLSCGGDVTTTDGGACAADAATTACPCTEDAGTIEGTCACAALIGCTGTRWACYPLAAGCPATEPAESSPCTNASLKCDYVRANGSADEMTCDGTQWNVGTVTTFCK